MTEPVLPLQGHCQCGAIRYTVSGTPFHRTFCHCADCRRTSGAPVMAWFSIALADYRVTQGAPASFRSSSHATRTFCGQCGTPLTYKHDALDELDVSVCSLDDPEQVPPADHTFVRSAVRWAQMQDGLPRYETTRG